MNIFGKIENLKQKFNIEILFVILFTIGAIGHTIPILQGYIILLTPYILLISSITFIIKLKLHPTLIAVICMIIVLGYTLELIGVQTGVPFGSYRYGDVMGLKLFDVPIIIAINWGMIILSSYIFSQHLVTKINSKFVILSPIVTGIIATLFDYVMEPVAIYLNYWRWTDIKVPTENYITWFIFSFIMAIFILITTRGNTFKYNKIAIAYIVAQLLFFTILNIYLL